ncbi:hypothetical protein TWF281_003716 [Arthrobotrys megalospora]
MDVESNTQPTAKDHKSRVSEMREIYKDYPWSLYWKNFYFLFSKFKRARIANNYLEIIRLADELILLLTAGTKIFGKPSIKSSENFIRKPTWMWNLKWAIVFAHLETTWSRDALVEDTLQRISDQLAARPDREDVIERALAAISKVTNKEQSDRERNNGGIIAPELVNILLLLEQKQYLRAEEKCLKGLQMISGSLEWYDGKVEKQFEGDDPLCRYTPICNFNEDSKKESGFLGGCSEQDLQEEMAAVQCLFKITAVIKKHLGKEAEAALFRSLVNEEHDAAPTFLPKEMMGIWENIEVPEPWAPEDEEGAWKEPLNVFSPVYCRDFDAYKAERLKEKSEEEDEENTRGPEIGEETKERDMEVELDLEWVTTTMESETTPLL